MRARDNPFRTERLAALPFRHGALDAEALHGRWRALGARAAIVGPHGSGKTTLLRELAERFAAEGRRVKLWCLNAASRRPSARALVREARALTAGDVLVCDGASHLPRSTWWRVRRASRGAGGVLVTSHVEGLLPTLLATHTDTALLAALARELLGPQAQRLAPLLAALQRRHAGNLHDVFLALYDLAARDDPRLSAGIAHATSESPWEPAGTPGRDPGGPRALSNG